MKKHHVVSLFKRNNEYLTRSQLPDRNTYEEIRGMIKTRKVERIKNGLYFMEGRPAALSSLTPKFDEMDK